MDFTAGKNTRTLEQVGAALNGPSARAELSHQSVPLPDKPLVVIQPGRLWTAVRLREMWAYRELFYFLIWRDIKVRYKQTVIGFAWVVVQPLFQTLFYTLFFGMLAHVPSEGVPYPVFVFAGLVPWTFFSRAVASSSNSLVGSSGLITKVYFPRMIIPGAAVASSLLDFAISFCVLLGMMVYYRVAVTRAIVMLPFLVVLVTLFALGLGMLTSALNVKYRDIGQLLPLVLQVWMYASPIVYPATLIPPKWRWLITINPMTGIVDGFRAAILAQTGFNWRELALASAIILSLLVCSAYAFKRMERNFADIV